MKVKTTTLKRYRILSGIIIIILLPITAFFTLFIKLGEGSEWVCNNIIHEVAEFIRNTTVRIFKWDKIATNRYNKDNK